MVDEDGKAKRMTVYLMATTNIQRINFVIRVHLTNGSTISTNVTSTAASNL